MEKKNNSKELEQVQYESPRVKVFEIEIKRSYLQAISNVQEEDYGEF